MAGVVCLAAVAALALNTLSDVRGYTIAEGRGLGSILTEVHAPVGSVVCFDSGSIHHGKRITGATATRAAATVYFSSP